MHLFDERQWKINKNLLFAVFCPQTFVKGYLISFVRLLLGIDAQENSGHLSSVGRGYLVVNCLCPSLVCCIKSYEIGV